MPGVEGWRPSCPNCGGVLASASVLGGKCLECGEDLSTRPNVAGDAGQSVVQPGAANQNVLIKSLDISAHIPIKKRDFDPGVGPHGRDRDKLATTDFAGAHRSFPITSPGDVSDALRSLGRTNQDRDKVRARILAIARRKGYKTGVAKFASVLVDLDDAVCRVFGLSNT